MATGLSNQHHVLLMLRETRSARQQTNQALCRNLHYQNVPKQGQRFVVKNRRQKRYLPDSDDDTNGNGNGNGNGEDGLN
jgi:hypothetical protein